MPALVHLGSRRRYLVAERLTIGRDAASDVVIEDALVSVAHAEIVRDGARYVIRDLGSRRGTFVDARRVSEAVLADGTELLIGPVRLRFEVAGERLERRRAPSPLPPSDEREELRRLRAVAELSRAIGVEHDLDRLLERVLETCFQLLRADRGAIIVFPPGSKTPSATVARTRSGAPVAEALSTSVLSQVMATREPYRRTEITGDLALQRSASLSAQGVRSLIAVPLNYDAAEPEWLGMIQLDSQVSNNVFDPLDLDVLVAIAGQAALAIKNAMLVRALQSAQHDHLHRLERVVTNLPVGVIVLDDQRRCALVNDWITARAATIGALATGQLAEHILGIATERLIGTDLLTQVTLDAPARTYLLVAHSSRDGAETVIAISDATEQRAHQARAAHQDRLALVGQLAGGIAHDFNNLLVVILNYADLLAESVGAGEAREDALTIAQAAKSAGELVQQLLAFSRAEAVKPSVVDVGLRVRAMEHLLRGTVGAGVDLTIDVGCDQARVLIDPTQLEQVIMNLVVNARDALTGGGRIAIAVRTEVMEGAELVVLSVGDNGAGIPPETVQRVFEPYFTTKARGKGTGLGLATVHGIIHHAGGEITLQSQVGVGTTFVIRLPATAMTTATAVTSSGPGRGRILLVDDDDAVRRAAERILTRGGYSVTSVASGPDALIAARTGPAFDLLLTDMVMPGMSGRDLARELPRFRVVFMSGYHHGTALPPWQFLAKPFDRETLLAKVADALAPGQHLATG